jgi:hypothetical protein
VSANCRTVPTSVTAIVVANALANAGVAKIASYDAVVQTSGQTKKDREVSSDSVANEPASTYRNGSTATIPTRASTTTLTTSKTRPGPVLNRSEVRI